MAKKQIIKTGIEARDELAKGAERLAVAVGSTLGPFGQNFFTDKGMKITNDGVSVAREILLQDEIQNLGATAVRESSIKTNDQVGDGTTTACILAYAIYKSASAYLSKSGVIGKKTPAEIVRQIEKERLEVIEKLEKASTPILTKEDLIHSATVSVEDPDLGKLIGEAQWNLGKDGYLLAEETTEKNSSAEQIAGVRIDNGFGTSQVVNNQQKRTCEVEDTKVILTSYSIKDFSDWQKIGKIIEQIAKTGSNRIVVIARAWTDETINYCLQNLNKGAMKIYPFNAPYVDMQERMKDLAAVVGATFCDSESMTLDDLNLSDVGFSPRITGRLFDAIITGSGDDKTRERITKRVEEIKARIEGESSDFEKKNYQERIAQLENGFGVIKVGHASDLERKRLLDKCEDAVNAVRVAFQEGTCKGAGMAYKEIADTLPDTYILKRPLQSIFEQIMASAPADFVVEDWVRDPLLVLKTALTNACGAASSLATAGGAIAQKNPGSLDEIFGKQIAQAGNE